MGSAKSSEGMYLKIGFLCFVMEDFALESRIISAPGSAIEIVEITLSKEDLEKLCAGKAIIPAYVPDKGLLKDRSYFL